MDSSLDRAFELSNNLNHWAKWSPWTALNDSIKVTIGDISTGIGASQTWHDNNGGGRLIFIESIENKKISYNIWFGDAKNPAISNMTFKQLTVNKIQVHWTIEGDMQIPIIGFIFALLMDTLVGPAFELGLENLKEISEK